DLKAQLQDKGIVTSELKKLIEKLKGKSVDTKFKKSSVIRQLNAFKSQRPSVLSKLTTFSNSFEKKISQSQRVIPTTSLSRPQLKRNPMGDRVMRNNSQGKKQEVEDQRRSVKLPKNKTSITACSCGIDLYSITLQDINFPNPVCLMAKATSSQAWLWYRRLSHLNFDTINLLSKNDIVVGVPKLKFIKDHLFSSCELGKAKRKSFHIKITPSLKRRLQLLHMDLCGPMRVASIKGKRYVLVIVDDYSRYTWTHFLRSKDETPEVLIDFLRLVQRGLQAQVRIVRTDKGTKFLNQTLHVYFATEGILHQTSVAQTPKQNGIVERRNRTLVEAARTMLNAAKVPLFFWAEAISTTCFTQNRPLVISRHEKTPYHIINDRKPSVKFFHIFGSLCYIVRDGENLDKMKEKGDACIFVGTALEHDSLSPGPQCQDNATQADTIVTTSNELDLVFSLMFDELLNGSSKVLSKSSAVTTADALNQRQKEITTPLNTHTTPDPTCQVPPQAPTVTSTENMNHAEMVEEYAQVENDEFINILCTPIQEQGEKSSHHVDSSNMHTLTCLAFTSNLTLSFFALREDSRMLSL
nr:retrovirus-related Pol polyprotein from transposon TNT 1-94 [Tanacetum cinerariifolium]